MHAVENTGVTEPPSRAVDSTPAPNYQPPDQKNNPLPALPVPATLPEFPPRVEKPVNRRPRPNCLPLRSKDDPLPVISPPRDETPKYKNKNSQSPADEGTDKAIVIPEFPSRAENPVNRRPRPNNLPLRDPKMPPRKGNTDRTMPYPPLPVPALLSKLT